MNTARLKILLHRAGAVLALAGIGFVSLRLYNYSAAMDFSALGAGAWTALAVCAALYGLAGLLMAKAWHSILRHLNLNVSTAWAVQARHALDFGDCLAVACAQHSGCSHILSLHLPHGAEFGGVTVVHPLQQAAPQDPEA